MNKKKCDKECIGIIKKIRYANHYRRLTVQYNVDGKDYELTETEVNKPYETIKLGFIPIGHKTKPLIELKTKTSPTLGGTIKVKYCSSNPKIAFLPDNDAKINWC